MNTELHQILTDLLNLPEAKEQLKHLHRGVGTNTQHGVWLRLEEYMANEEPQ